MRIFSWNVNGLRAVVKKDSFKPFIERFTPDILCLQETKAKEGQAETDLPEYEEYWHSAEKAGYAGTAVFTKREPIEAIYGLPSAVIEKYELADQYGDTAKEGRVTTLEFEEFFVTSVYTPNAKEDLSRLTVRQEWDRAFLEYMAELKKEKPVVFCGDLNVAHMELDLARPKENEGRKGFTTEERRGIDAMLKAGFVDTFRLFTKDGGHYTWWSHFANARERNVGWRIDYVMVSEELVPLVKRAQIHPDILGSDHCPVSIELTL